MFQNLWNFFNDIFSDICNLLHFPDLQNFRKKNFFFVSKFESLKISEFSHFSRPPPLNTPYTEWTSTPATRSESKPKAPTAPVSPVTLSESEPSQMSQLLRRATSRERRTARRASESVGMSRSRRVWTERSLGTGWSTRQRPEAPRATHWSLMPLPGTILWAIWNRIHSTWLEWLLLIM